MDLLREKQRALGHHRAQVAAAIIGSAVVGGVMSSQASKSAADAQSGASSDANALQKYIFDEQKKMQEPWRQAGLGGLNKLSYLMGLSPTAGGGVGRAPTVQSADQIRQRLVAQFTSNGSAVPIAPTGQEGADGSNTPNTPGVNIIPPTINEAALQQAIEKEQKKQQAILDQFNAKAGRIAGRDPTYGSLLNTFGKKDFEVDPGYEFRQAEGEKAMQRAASVGGGIDSGAMFKDAMRFNQGLASEEYGKAYDRFNNNQDRTYNKLASISGVGQTASNNIGSAAQNYGNQASGNIIGAGNAQAAGRVGSANAWNNALGQGVSMYQQNQLMNSFNTNSTPSYYSGLGGGSGNYNYGGGF